MRVLRHPLRPPSGTFPVLESFITRIFLQFASFFSLGASEGDVTGRNSDISQSMGGLAKSQKTRDLAGYGAAAPATRRSRPACRKPSPSRFTLSLSCRKPLPSRFGPCLSCRKSFRTRMMRNRPRHARFAQAACAKRDEIGRTATTKGRVCSTPFAWRRLGAYCILSE